MGRYYDDRDYDYYDDYDDDDKPSLEEIKDTLRDITALTMDYDGNPKYDKSVNRVFYDIFGVRDMGYIFASGGRRATRAKVKVVYACGKDRLIDMFADTYTRKTIQALVKLHYDANHSRKNAKLDDVSEVYTEAISRIQEKYGIRGRSSVSAIGDPYKYLRKLNREYEDSRGYYNDYDDYDDYDDYYSDSRRRSSRRRRRDDDDYYYDDTDTVASILEGVDPDIIKRKSTKSRRSRRDRGDREVTDEYSDNSDDIFDRLDKIEAKIDERRDRDVYSIRDDKAMSSDIDVLNKSVLAVAQAQDEMRKDVDNIIDVLHNAFTDEDDDTDDSPGDRRDTSSGSGDLMKTTGGIITDPKQLK
jgi:hypothetical protein